MTAPERRRLLTGVRLDPDASVPQLWCLIDVTARGDEREIEPVLRDGRLVVFSDPAADATRRDDGSADDGPAIEPDLLIDVAHTLYCLESDVPEEGTLVYESLTLLLALVDAVDQTMPSPMLAAVMAARASASGEGSLDARTRGLAIDGVLWGVGAVAVLTTVG